MTKQAEEVFYCGVYDMYFCQNCGQFKCKEETEYDQSN